MFASLKCMWSSNIPLWHITYSVSFFSLLYVTVLCFRWDQRADHGKANHDRQHDTIRYEMKQKMITCSICLSSSLKKNSPLLCFWASGSLNPTKESYHAASGLQAWAINIAFLPSTCICGGEWDFLLHQKSPNGDNPSSWRKERDNILCLNAAHLGHEPCLQTPGEGNLTGSSLTIFIAILQNQDRQSVSVLPATELAVVQQPFQWVCHQTGCRKPRPSPWMGRGAPWVMVPPHPFINSKA